MTEPNIRTLPLASIILNPRYAELRQEMPNLDDLVADIRANGQTTPVFAQRLGGGYELIAGHCRHAALTRLKSPTIVARIFEDLSDRAAEILSKVVFREAVLRGSSSV